MEEKLSEKREYEVNLCYTWLKMFWGWSTVRKGHGAGSKT
jgi:hypothetical protein